jgi:hypothetical protein
MKKKISQQNNLDYYFSLEAILISNYNNIIKDKKLINFFSEFIFKVSEIEKRICVLTYSFLVYNEIISYYFLLKIFLICFF